MSPYRDGADKIFATDDGENHFIRCAMPIISGGDIIGCVASLAEVSGERSRDAISPDVESKLVLAAAGFLGKQIET